MKLYYSPGSCALASHIVFEELGLTYELVKVSTKTHQTEDRILMGYSMSAAMKAEVIQAVTTVPATNARGRVQQAVYLVCTSSQYQVQR